MRVHSHFVPYKRYRKIFAMFIIVFFISTVYSPQSLSIMTSHPRNKETDTNLHNGYIIELNEEPLSIFENNLRIKMKNLFSHLTNRFSNILLTQWGLQYKNRILSVHKEVKKDILELTGKTSDIVFSKEFTVLFNGISIKKVPDSILEKIDNLPDIRNIIPDYKITIALNDSVPLINADAVWNLHDRYGKNITGSGVKIAILDTGVDYSHPDLRDNFVGGYDFVNNDSDPMDDNGHGTHCAGIAVGTGAASGFKFVGVAPDADLYAYKVMDDEGSGYTSWFLEGMEQAIDPNGDGDFSDHVNVISISAGDSSGNPNDPLSLAADNAVDLGVIVVAAAGNDGPSYNTISSPGCARKVICVGATDKNDKVASFSSRGSDSAEIVKPDIMAPGVGITSTWPGGGYKSLSGTSMACPHVTGAVALLLQMHPNWTSDKIKTALGNSAVDIGHDLTTQGYGRIDVLNAVTLPDVLPISILNISGEVRYGLVGVYGTAMADDFQNYTLYYGIVNKSNQCINWVKLYEGDEEVNNDILFTWNTQLLHSGNYELKLDVRDKNQTSVAITFISLRDKNDSKKLFIQAPNEINEFEHFTVSATDLNGTPQKAWFLLTFPYSLPKIRYGISVTFRAPVILDQRIKSLRGTLTVFRSYPECKNSKKYITVVNT